MHERTTTAQDSLILDLSVSNNNSHYLESFCDRITPFLALRDNEFSYKFQDLKEVWYTIEYVLTKR